MPHSSGGGSHSGGSHSSHSSHSGGGSRHSGGGSSSSGSSRRTSSTPFPGCRRYLYYKDDKPCLVYSNYDIRKGDTFQFVLGLIIFGLMFVPFIILGIVFMFHAFSFPKKIEYSKYKRKAPEFVIEDNLGVFENEAKLEKSMSDFYDTTGVVPAVITVTNDTWKEDYASLEAYAYDEYVNRFPDEVHWLFVYSSAEKDNGFDDWYWEGMQGDDTDPVLISDRVNAFNEDLNTRLLQRSKYSVDDAFAITFDEYAPIMMKMTFKPKILFGGICLAVIMGAFYFSVAWYLKPKKVPEEYKKAVPCELKAVYQASCNFCGGMYVVGMHTGCPHCGAAIPPQNYIQDPQGNIVKIL